MTKRQVKQPETADRDFSGLLTQYLVSYLQTCTPAGTLEHILQLAGEERGPSTLCDATTWSSYGQYRALLEATSEVLGAAALVEVANHVYDDIQSAELSESLSALGSPWAVYETLPEFVGSTTPILGMRTERTGPQECRVEFWFQDGFEPFRENCTFQFALCATLPSMFGYPDAEVIAESCQCDGAATCSVLMRWQEVDDEAAKTSRAELQSRLSQARLEELQRTVAELVSGDGLNTVLARVVAAAGRAVPAKAYVLDIKASCTSDRWLCTQGIDEDAAGLLAEQWRSGSPEPAPHLCVIAVESDRNQYGHFIAVRPEVASFEPLDRSVLESYARLAATALDSEAILVDARQQANTAEALLTLSSSLSDLASTEEMVQRVVHAVPWIVNCDRSLIWLMEPSAHVGMVEASHGFDRATDSALRALAIPVQPSGPVVSESWRHELASDHSPLHVVLKAAGSLAALSFPIVYDNEMYGWITVDVTEYHERLDDNANITERLRGLAGQAAVAIRNGRLLEEIRHQALHDSLTGLPNRVLMLDRAAQSLARARREHFDLALLFIDIDGFKGVNDSLGHATGDRLLQAIAARFAGTLRGSDTVARLGGDEFVVLTEGLSLAAGPELVAERLLAVLAEPFEFDGDTTTSVSVSASIGIANGLRDNAEELLRDADIALYAAKEAGKNRYAVFEAEMQMEMRSRHELEMDLQAAIGTDQFFLLYQPIFNLQDMSVVGVEALLRWNHPTRGLLQPDEFIPALEASGLIIPVGRWVLLEACRQAMIWRQGGQATRMSVNASTRQFDADSLLNDVWRALGLSGLPPDDLIIEITETSLMRDTKNAQRQLTALKSLGVRIAVDDFGTGYSSLAYLQKFPVDTLKIDRSFISGMAKTPEGDALIHTLLQLGKALHLETLAEGIEEAGQLAQLLAENCDIGQGYLFARPLPADEVQTLFMPAQTHAVLH
jgi:diguanylate cyclase (GGDEF)-like protein